MGAGSDWIVPGTLSLLTNIFPSNRRGRYNDPGSFAGFGGVLGPITSGDSWAPYIGARPLLSTCPSSVIALLAGVVLLPQSKDKIGQPRPGWCRIRRLRFGGVRYRIIDRTEHSWYSPEIVTSYWAWRCSVRSSGWELAHDEPMFEASNSSTIGASRSDRGTITVQYFAPVRVPVRLLAVPPTIARLHAPADGWGSVRNRALGPGGCFFPAVSRMVQRFGPRVVVTSGLTCCGDRVPSRGRHKWGATLSMLYRRDPDRLGDRSGDGAVYDVDHELGAEPKAGVGSESTISPRTRRRAGIAILGSIVNLVYRSRLDAHVSAEPPCNRVRRRNDRRSITTLIASAITVWRFPALHQPKARSSLDD